MMERGGPGAPSLRYAETDDLQLLELPYEGEQLFMLLMLPPLGFQRVSTSV